MKKILFITLILLLIPLIVADEQLIVSCGGDEELIVGCPVSDEELTFLGGGAPSGVSGASQGAGIDDEDEEEEVPVCDTTGCKIRKAGWKGILIVFASLTFVWFLFFKRKKKKKEKAKKEKEEQEGKKLLT